MAHSMLSPLELCLLMPTSGGQGSQGASDLCQHTKSKPLRRCPSSYHPLFPFGADMQMSTLRVDKMEESGYELLICQAPA